MRRRIRGYRFFMLIAVITAAIISFSGCEETEKEQNTKATVPAETAEEEEGLKLEAYQEGFYKLLTLEEMQGKSAVDGFWYGQDQYVAVLRDLSSSKWSIVRKNIRTGEVTPAAACQTEQGTCVAVKLGKDGKVYCFGLDGKVLIYNAQWQLEEVRDTGKEISDFYFDSQRQNLYLIDDRAELWCYHFPEAKLELLLQLDSAYTAYTLDGMLEEKQILLLSAYDEDGNDVALYYSVETKEMESGGNGRYNRLVSGNSILFWAYDNNIIKWVDTDHNRVVTSFALESKEETGEILYDDAGRLFMTNTYTDDSYAASVIRIYDKEQQEQVGQLQMDTKTDSFQLLTLNSAESDYAMLLCHSGQDAEAEQKGTLLLWQYKAAIEQYTPSDTDQISNYYAIGGDAVENNKKVRKIEKDYGIKLYLRNEAVCFFPDFAVTPTSDEQAIDTALKTLDEICDVLGKEFFEEFTYGDVKGLEIYFCGTLIQGAEEGTSMPVAFALQWDNKQILVVDITQDSESIRNSICHEIWHAIESKIDYLAENGTANGFDAQQWEKLNPKDFTYFDSYVMEDGSDVSTQTSPEYTPETAEVYFVDGYSKSYIGEDRARIFENFIWVRNASELPEVCKNPHIQEKAAYMFEVLQDSFPNVKAFANPAGITLF